MLDLRSLPQFPGFGVSGKKPVKKPLKTPLEELL